MSTVTDTTTLDSLARMGAATERLPHRLDGMLIAAGASLMLWAGLGAGVWGVINLVG